MEGAKRSQGLLPGETFRIKLAVLTWIGQCRDNTENVTVTLAADQPGHTTCLLIHKEQLDRHLGRPGSLILLVAWTFLLITWPDRFSQGRDRNSRS